MSLGLEATGAIEDLTRAPEASRLKSLALRDLSDSMMEELARLDRIESLTVHGIHRFPAEAYAAHEKLERLSLDAEVTNEDIAILARAPFASRLRELGLLDAWLLTDAAIPDLLSFPRLERLDMHGAHNLTLELLRTLIPEVHAS